MQHVSYGRRRSYLRFFFLIILISICISQSIYAKDDWKMVKNADDVQVYVRPYKNSNIDECKGIVTIFASIDIVYAIICYAPFHKKLMHTCYDSFLVRPWEKGCQAHYFAFKAPWPIWDRDLIYETCAKLDHKTGNIVVTSRIVEDTSVPIKNKIIRVVDSNNTWTLEKLGHEKTRVTYRNYFNPEIAKIIPQSFVNLICKDVPFYTLINMRNLAKEPIYKELAPKYRLE
ncbi:MAG: hypothetical protein APR62_03970 [Smithella sp. SDB]|nr:MAG: hypothetical protein APR62_03970 [Smithella sp. SDB]